MQATCMRTHPHAATHIYTHTHVHPPHVHTCVHTPTNSPAQNTRKNTSSVTSAGDFREQMSTMLRKQSKSVEDSRELLNCLKRWHGPFPYQFGGTDSQQLVSRTGPLPRPQEEPARPGRPLGRLPRAARRQTVLLSPAPAVEILGAARADGDSGPGAQTQDAVPVAEMLL